MNWDEDERRPQSRHYRTINGVRALVCDECGADMVKRTNRSTGEKFYGCSNYPRCMHTCPIPEDEKMRDAGAAPLPGFD